VLFNPKLSRPALGPDYRRTSAIFTELVKKISAVHGTVMFISVVLILCQIEVSSFLLIVVISLLLHLRDGLKCAPPRPGFPSNFVLFSCPTLYVLRP
jgi:hypothetical protein